MSAADEGFVLVLDFTQREPERPLSRRVWSKGSARGAGPKQGAGLVRRGQVSHPDTPRCTCGNVKRCCDGCGEFFCASPGHAAHCCRNAGCVCSSCAAAVRQAARAAGF